MSQPGGSSPTKSMTVMEHIRELRTRFMFVAVVFVVVASLAYVFRDQLITLLLEPLHGQKLVYLNPAGGFSFIFLVSLYAGLAVAVPLLIQQIYGFIRPMLPTHAQRYTARVIIASFLLLIAGIAFGYLIAIPGALNFLQEFASEYVEASLTADSYLKFIVAYTIGLGLVFQLPLFLLLIHWIKPLSPTGLLKSERWIIVLAFVAAAIITPTPDPLNQTIVALPIIAVYQLGVGVILVSTYRQRRAAKEQLVRPSAHPITPSPETAHQPALKPKAASPAVARTRRSLDGMLSSAPSAKQKETPHLSSAAPHQQRVYSIDGISRIAPASS